MKRIATAALLIPLLLAVIKFLDPWAFFALGAVFVLANFYVFGLLQNLLVSRRTFGKIILPVLVFVFLSPTLPGGVWRLVVGLACALIFRRRMSIFAPMTLFVGFLAAVELLTTYWAQLPIPTFMPTWALAAAALFLGLTGTILLAACGRKIPARQLYFSGMDKTYRWNLGIGLTVIIFSALGAVVLIAAFLG